MDTPTEELQGQLDSLKSELEELAQIVKELRQEVTANKESLGTLSQWIEKLGKFVKPESK